MAKKGKYSKKSKMNSTSTVLFIIRFIFLTIALAVIYNIIKIQFFWTPDAETYKYLSSTETTRRIDPVRGSILATDGRILACAMPMYKIEMDCCVLKNDFRRDKEEGPKKEKQWREKAKELSKGLEKLIGNKSADEYYKEIIGKRDKGSHSYNIAPRVSHETLLELKKLPLFNESSYKGGLIVTKLDTREYPYGSLARSALGYVKSNNDTSTVKRGIEGRYDEVLHGKEGHEKLKMTDEKKKIPIKDSTTTKVEDGKDIRTTIDVDIQNIADRALRKFFLESPSSEKIVEGCTAVMEVKTGAIRAMVNLKKNSDGSVGETYNYCIGRKGEPGSVFKAVTIMTLLEDGKITSLKDSVPTFGGSWTFKGKTFEDTEHLNAKRFPSGWIKIEDALMISCNNVFRYLAAKNYEKYPARYTKKVGRYGFMDDFGFDIDGLAATKIPSIDTTQQWSYQDLAQMGMGYAVELTPLHLLTLYNGIANGGKLMKPYLVEDIEKDGKTTKRFGPKVLNGSMCSKATAEELTRGLIRVTSGKNDDRNMGTAYYQFLRSKCTVAGKTGTARMKVTENAKPGDAYQTIDGRRQFQATFVGFFPAENPKYTVITTVYSKPIIGNMYGSACAEVAREITDDIYCLNPEWGEQLKASGSVPKMSKGDLVTEEYSFGEVPDLKGLGLMDAVYSIENCGYRCSYEGEGHVKSQDPKAGTKYSKGNTVRIVLR